MTAESVMVTVVMATVMLVTCTIMTCLVAVGFFNLDIDTERRHTHTLFREGAFQRILRVKSARLYLILTCTTMLAFSVSVQVRVPAPEISLARVTWDVASG